MGIPFRPHGLMTLGGLVCRGIIEFAVVVYILLAITDRNTSLIISVLGLIYATIRDVGVEQRVQYAKFAEVLDENFYILRQAAGDTREPKPDNDFASPINRRFMLEISIKATSAQSIKFACLLNIFWKLL